MAPLISETDYLVTDIGDYNFFSEAVVSKQTSTAPLHSASAKSRRRRVAFATDVIEHGMMSRVEYTAEEMKATWYDRSSLRQMKDCARSEARLVESGVLVEGDDVSIRGLEAKTSNGLRRKRQNRMNAYAAVFFEIDTQQDMGMADDDAVADAYFTFSEPCLVAAHMIALRDAEDAKIAMQSMKSGMKFGANLLFKLATPASDSMLISSAA
jgi:hypothetical protein